jgi:hypothetical protein
MQQLHFILKITFCIWWDVISVKPNPNWLPLTPFFCAPGPIQSRAHSVYLNTDWIFFIFIFDQLMPNGWWRPLHSMQQCYTFLSRLHQIDGLQILRKIVIYGLANWRKCMNHSETNDTCLCSFFLGQFLWGSMVSLGIHEYTPLCMWSSETGNAPLIFYCTVSLSWSFPLSANLYLNLFSAHTSMKLRIHDHCTPWLLQLYFLSVMTNSDRYLGEVQWTISLFRMACLMAQWKWTSDILTGSDYVFHSLWNISLHVKSFRHLAKVGTNWRLYLLCCSSSNTHFIITI